MGADFVWGEKLLSSVDFLGSEWMLGGFCWEGVGLGVGEEEIWGSGEKWGDLDRERLRM